MDDVQQQNYGVMTGTPALVTGLLPNDSNQALTFNGSTNSMSVPDSTSDSLAVPDGGPGGAAIELWCRFATLPGADKALVSKPGSYEVGITSTNHFYVFFANGANNVTVNSSLTVQANTTYHLAGVLNNDYTGATIFGNQTQGTSQFALFGDYSSGVPTGSTNNLQVCKFTIPEKGQSTSLAMDLQRVHDAFQLMNLAGVIYRDASGLPGALVGQSPHEAITPDTLTTRQWVTFGLSAALYPGDYWLGVVGGSDQGQLQIGYETTGGTRKWRAASVTDSSNYFGELASVPDPFGTPVSGDSAKFAIYCNYAHRRTGDEGKALLYVNGQLDNSTAYAHGIADTANAISVAPTVAVTLDEISIWAKKLTPVQVARHYAAR